MSDLFKETQKEVRMLLPGDVVVDNLRGARLVTAVTTNLSGDFIIRFHLPNEKSTNDNALTVDRYWGVSMVPVLHGDISTGKAGEVDLLRAQLAARDAALNSVLELAEKQANGGDMQYEHGGEQMLALLVRNGVHKHD